MTTTKRVKTVASVFELPQKLGILQYVEYEPPPREWCTSDGCLYEGVLTAEGCKKGVCVRYRVWVYSRDRRRWEAKEKWRRRRDEDAGGCIRQQVADALWELAEKYDVGVWYRRVEEKRGVRYETYVYCGPVVNGVELDQPQCRTVDECVKQISRGIQEGGGEEERASSAVAARPGGEAVEGVAGLEAFGTEWVRKWAILRDRLVEIAKVLKRFPWIVEVVKQRPMNILHPYMIEVYMTKDGSETCLCLNPPKAYCAQNGAVREVGLELEFKRYETYEEKIREVYRPKGLLAFAATAREYVKIL